MIFLFFVERRTSNTNTTPQNQQFNDNQQLFLGNIPHHATDDELKALFSRFGTVVDLRILSKQGQPKIPGQRPPPNYGFITYEDAAAVQECLANLVRKFYKKNLVKLMLIQISFSAIIFPGQLSRWSKIECGREENAYSSSRRKWRTYW